MRADAERFSGERARARHRVACITVQKKQYEAGMPVSSMDELWPLECGELLELWREAHREEEMITTRGMFDMLA